MITELIGAARSLRGPLTLGYSALATIWIGFGERLGSLTDDPDGLAARFADLVDTLGSTTRFALWTFTAYIIGSMLWNVVGERLVRWLSRRAGHADWDAYIAQARAELRRYEAYNVQFPHGSGQRDSFQLERTSHWVPSPGWAAHLAAEVEDRSRAALEVEYRITLGVAALPVLVALSITTSGSAWVMAAMLVPAVDLLSINYTTKVQMHRAQLESLRQRIVDTSASENAALERLEEHRANLEVANNDSSADIRKAERQLTMSQNQVNAAQKRLAELVAQEEHLKNMKRRQFFRSGLLPAAAPGADTPEV